MNSILRWILEKIPVISWLNGYKHTIGTILTALSVCIVAIQEALVQLAVCPTWEYCQYFDVINGWILLLLSLLVKYVGEWHKAIKEIDGGK